MQFFGNATGSGEVTALNGVEAICCGLDYGVFNIAVLTDLIGAGSGLEKRLAECVRHFQTRTPRWSFWLCEDFLEPQVRRRARSVFAAVGMRVISQPPGMFTESLGAPGWQLPPLECRPVDNQTMRDTFAGITSTCFDIPVAVANAVYRPERAWWGSYRGYVGLRKGQPVAIAATVDAADVLGVYSLATLPEFRRQGMGEALLRAAVAREQERLGPRRIVLQSTEAGYRMYRRLGFRDVAKFSVYLTG